MAQHERRRAERVEQLGEFDREHRLRGGQWNQVDFRRGDERERPFRADDHLCQIEWCGRIDELDGNFRRDPGTTIFEEPLQCDPQIGLKNPEKTFSLDMHRLPFDVLP